MKKIYKRLDAVFVEDDEGKWLRGDFCIDGLFRSENPKDFLEGRLKDFVPVGSPMSVEKEFCAPVDDQEVWASGVTYFRSREARMEESEKSGADCFYDAVYDADRPELFFKATGRRCVGHGQRVRIREDSKWNVPEPELVLAVNAAGKVFGYTIGNDMSSRDIEGENPLYLPQAKVYKDSCALGPCLVVGVEMTDETKIEIKIERDGSRVFEGETRLAQLKRSFEELVGYLYRDNEFVDGCYLMTGTGIVPSSNFSLNSGDCISISIEGIGTLKNTVA